MSELLLGWPGRDRCNFATRRAAAHVNPLPARKPSKRAKYGDKGQDHEGLQLGLQPRAPRVVRPRPKRAEEYFRELIRDAEAGVDVTEAGRGEVAQLPAPEGHRRGGGVAPGQEGSLTAVREPLGRPLEGVDHLGGQQPQLQPQAYPLGPRREQLREQHREHQAQGLGRRRSHEELPPAGQCAAKRRWGNGGCSAKLWSADERGEAEDDQASGQQRRQRSPQQDLAPWRGQEPQAPAADSAQQPQTGAPTSTATATASAQGPLPQAAPGFGSSTGLRGLRRKLFADSLDGPHPRTTGRIVARLAACRSWRRPLATRLLPRFLPLFDQHAAAYFFKHVPSLQPPDPRTASPSASVAVAPETYTPLPLTSVYDNRSGPYGGHRRGTAGGIPPSGAPHSSAPSASARETAGFRRMVLAVCCSLLPKMGSFGPRALSMMAAGLGRMRISHEPTLAAWRARSLSQMGFMRPDQLVASLEGLAALQPLRDQRRVWRQRQQQQQLRQHDKMVEKAQRCWKEPGADEGGVEGRRCGAEGVSNASYVRGPISSAGLCQGPGQAAAPALKVEAGAEGAAPGDLEGAPDPLWRAAALKAMKAALPGMRVGEVGRLLQAVAVLRLAPPPELLDAACERIRQAVLEEAAGLDVVAGTTSADGDERALLRVARARAEMAASPLPLQISVAGKHSGVVVVGAAAAAASASADRTKARRSGRGTAAVDALSPPPPPPPPEPLHGGDLSRVLLGLAALRHTPPPDWLSWLVGSCRSAVRGQLEDRRRRRLSSQPPKKWLQGTMARTWVPAMADPPYDLAVVPGVGGAALEATEGAPPPLTTASTGVSFFTANDLGELLAAVAELLLGPPSGGENGGRGNGGCGDGDESLRQLPPAVPREWLDLLCEAALEEVRAQLDPEAAAAAVAAAAAPTAILTQSDVRKAEGAAAAALAGTAAAAAAAAARVVSTASLLLMALFRLLPLYMPPAQWCAAAAEVGLELVPYMPPPALLLWLRALGAWNTPLPLPPAWHAAAAVSSRANFTSYTVRQLCELPAAMAAADVRLPATWAAAYLRHLAAQLPSGTLVRAAVVSTLTPPSPAATTATPSCRRLHGAGTAGGVGFSRRGQRQQRFGALGRRTGSMKTRARGRAPHEQGRSRGSQRRGRSARTSGRMGPAEATLDDVATALAWLPDVVQDLFYAAECAGEALQALALALGVSLEPSSQAGATAVAATLATCAPMPSPEPISLPTAIPTAEAAQRPTSIPKAAEDGTLPLPEDELLQRLRYASDIDVRHVTDMQKGSWAEVGSTSSAREASAPGLGSGSVPALLLLPSKAGTEASEAVAVQPGPAAEHRGAEAAPEGATEQRVEDSGTALTIAARTTGSAGAQKRRRAARAKEAGSMPSEAVGAHASSRECGTPGADGARRRLRGELIGEVEAFFAAAGFPSARCGLTTLLTARGGLELRGRGEVGQRVTAKQQRET